MLQQGPGSDGQSYHTISGKTCSLCLKSQQYNGTRDVFPWATSYQLLLVLLRCRWDLAFRRPFLQSLPAVSSMSRWVAFSLRCQSQA